MNDTCFFKNPFTSTFCEMFNCQAKGSWLIGRPNDSSLVMPGSLRLCPACAASVVQNLPDELLQHVDVVRALEIMAQDKRAVLVDKYLPLLDVPAIENALESMTPEAREDLLARLVDKYIPEAVDKESGESEPVIESDKFICDYSGCGRTFGSQNALTAHQRVHKGASQ